MCLSIKGECQNNMRTISAQLHVLLNGPVQNALFRLLDQYGNVCVWFMARNQLPPWEPQVTIARNCRLSGVETPGSQPGNHGLPLQ